MPQSIEPFRPLPRNEVLKSLPSDEFVRLRPLLTRVKLVNGFELYTPGERIEHVYFIEQGFASIVAEVDDFASSIEVGLQGRESMTGLTSLLAPDATAFNRVMVQLPGAALRMSAGALRDCVETMPVLRQSLFRALEALLAQISQTAACNALHSLPERLARWLLMAHDRVDGDELHLTQEFLAIMLAVRRPGVSVAIGTLQAAGLLRHQRGRILISDRAGLEAAGCDCYRRVKLFTDSLAARDD